MDAMKVMEFVEILAFSASASASSTSQRERLVLSKVGPFVILDPICAVS